MPKQGKGISLVHLKSTVTTPVDKFKNALSGLVGRFFWINDSGGTPNAYWAGDPTFFGSNPSYYVTSYTSTQIYGFYVDTSNVSHVSSSTTDINSPPARQYYSIEWLGYFKAPYTDTYTFNLLSDDGSALWIGNNAISGFTLANATIDNHSLQGASTTASSSLISLVAGQYYPIRIQYGNFGTATVMNFWYTRSGNSTPVYNMAGQLYHLTNQDFVA